MDWCEPLIEPEPINIEPVNWCVSLVVSPNIVEPLFSATTIFVTDEDTISSSAVNVPWTVMPANVGESVVFNACPPTFPSTVVTREEKLPLATSKSATLPDKLALSCVNEPLISLAIWAEELNAPLNTPVYSDAVTEPSTKTLPNEPVVCSEPVYKLLNIAIKLSPLI